LPKILTPGKDTQLLLLQGTQAVAPADVLGARDVNCAVASLCPPPLTHPWLSESFQPAADQSLPFPDLEYPLENAAKTPFFGQE
jgi:hypothetical protein